jgi:hypothetical protein
MLNLCLTLLAIAMPQQDWTALELPELSGETNPDAFFPPVASGGHIQLDARDRTQARNSRALLTAQDVAALLERSAGAAGKNLALFPYSPPLLARGSDEDIAWARATLSAIDAAGKRQSMKLSAWLIPEAGASAPDGDGAWPQAHAWQAVVSPGEEIVFGQRLHEDFVANYDVNVSTDAGVAAPMVGGVTSGKTVHLRASKIRGGTGYHLRGQLDLAELAGFEEFDPDSPDLGKIRQPLVNSTTLNFSGVAESGEFLRVDLSGTPLKEPDWTLLVRVETVAEPEGPATDGVLPGHDWRAIDVTLLSTRSAGLPHFNPGAGIGDQVYLEAMSSHSAAITPSGVLSAVESGSRSSRTSRSISKAGPTTQIAEGLLLIAAGDSADSTADRVASFVRAVESPRLNTITVELRMGGLRATFPAASGEPVRLASGRERTLLTGYSAEIAPNTWMPIPIVEHHFDGLAWQGRLGGEQLHSSLWLSTTEEIAVRDRFEARLGAVQLPRRSVRAARKDVRIGDGSTELLGPLKNSESVQIELSAR